MQYPVKMLKDENGQPFVPLTHVKAVAGEEFTTAVLNAAVVSAGHYQIINDDLSTQYITGKVIAVKFESSSSAVAQNFLKINDETEYGLYKSDGVNYLIMTDVANAVCFFTFTGTKFQLLMVGADTQSGGGHAITDSEGTLMPQRSVLNFDGAEVVDIPGQGATSVKTGWISQAIGLKRDITSTGVWQPALNSSITLPQAGIYKFHVLLNIGDMTYVGRNIGIRIVKGTDTSTSWEYQYQKYKRFTTIVKSLTANSSINVEIYFDNMTSTDPVVISEAYMYIEYIPTKEVSV